jgi:hypothetical protein
MHMDRRGPLHNRHTMAWRFIPLTICNYSDLMVEAAGVEPASENNPPWRLHACLDI